MTLLLPVKLLVALLLLNETKSTHPWVMCRFVEISCTLVLLGISVSTRQLVGERLNDIPCSQAPRYSLFQKS